MVQPRDAVRLRWPARRLPGVEGEVMVVAAGGHEEHVAGRPPARHVACFVHDVEAEDPDVELAYPVDVRRAQVHVADPEIGIDRTLRTLHRLDWSLGPAHRRPLVTNRAPQRKQPTSGVIPEHWRSRVALDTSRHLPLPGVLTNTSDRGRLPPSRSSISSRTRLSRAALRCSLADAEHRASSAT